MEWSTPWAQAVAPASKNILISNLIRMQNLSGESHFERNANLRQVGCRHAYLQALLFLLPTQLVMESQQFDIENFARLLGTVGGQRFDGEITRRRTHHVGIEELALGGKAHILGCQTGLLALV